jgi:hypothetical protein
VRHAPLQVNRISDGRGKLAIAIAGVIAVRTARVLPGYRPDHCAGAELAAIDVHCAAEAATDAERRFDDGVAREARLDRFERNT